MRRSRKALKRISVGVGRRTVGVMRVAAKTGVAALRNGETETSDARWDHISEELGRMKGLMMKMGQMASYIEGALPPEAQPFLSKLQWDSDPLSYDVIQRVLEKTFGQPIEELFEHFEPKAIAAASIGQVHRATYQGQPVAVKVQYPDIRLALANDLKTASRLTQFGLMLTPGGGKDLAREMQERFLEECDYLTEAHNLKTFARMMADSEGISFPEVVEARCAPNVLTMHFVEGWDFQRFRTEATQEAKNRAAEHLAEFVWTSIFEYGIFNADPHPGNYLFQPNGDVVFLDFGCVKRFDRDTMAIWKPFARSILEQDRETFERTSREMGLVVKDRHFDWEGHWLLLQYLYRPFLQDDFAYTPEYVSEVYEMFKNHAPFRGGAMPGEMLFTNRLQWGFNSILSQLGGQADWKRIFHRAVYSELAEIPEVGRVDVGL